jgi:hypothetical protein
MILGTLTHLFEVGDPNDVQVEVEPCNKKIEETREMQPTPYFISATSPAPPPFDCA